MTNLNKQKYLKEVFGDSLLLDPVQKNETELPSPQDLKSLKQLFFTLKSNIH